MFSALIAEQTQIFGTLQKLEDDIGKRDASLLGVGRRCLQIEPKLLRLRRFISYEHQKFLSSAHTISFRNFWSHPRYLEGRGQSWKEDPYRSSMSAETSDSRGRKRPMACDIHHKCH